MSAKYSLNFDSDSFEPFLKIYYNNSKNELI